MPCTNPNHQDPPASLGVVRVLLSVEEAAESLGLGRTTLFNLIRAGQIKAVKCGKRRLIAASEVQAFAIRLQEGA